MKLIETHNLTKAYRNNYSETQALCDINIEIQAGELIGITGPSGCGKSTLLNLLGFIDKPDGGNYYLMGERVDGLNERQRAEYRKNNVGFVFQNFNLVNELTVFENVELPLLYANISKAERKVRVETLLDQMQMTHRKNHFPSQLSGGQQQRVAVARAVSNKPRLILADEPTGNLDSKRGDEVMSLLMSLNRAGTTVIMVTHALHYAAYCKRVIGLFDGRIITDKSNTLSYV